MNIYNFMQYRLKQIQVQILGYGIYSLTAFIILTTGIVTKNIFPWFSQALFFFLGWFTWTFCEYIAHRFWMHHKPSAGKKAAFSNHQHHHTHPTELKVSNSHRFLLFVICIFIVTTALILKNYFTLFAGFYAGFMSYSFMHVILHRKWSNDIFPGLLQNHILHHCKLTNKCFGVTVIWWDKIFATSAPESYHIPEKVIRYYFGDPKEKKETEIYEKLKISPQVFNN